MNEQDVLTVGRYSSLIEDLNRGLDYASSQAMEGDNHGAAQQYNHLMLKIQQLFQEDDGQLSMINAAKTIVDGKLLSYSDFV